MALSFGDFSLATGKESVFSDLAKTAMEGNAMKAVKSSKKRTLYSISNFLYYFFFPLLLLIRRKALVFSFFSKLFVIN